MTKGPNSPRAFTPEHRAQWNSAHAKTLEKDYLKWRDGGHPCGLPCMYFGLALMIVAIGFFAKPVNPTMVYAAIGLIMGGAFIANVGCYYSGRQETYRDPYVFKEGTSRTGNSTWRISDEVYDKAHGRVMSGAA